MISRKQFAFEEDYCVTNANNTIVLYVVNIYVNAAEAGRDEKDDEWDGAGVAVVVEVDEWERLREAGVMVAVVAGVEGAVASRGLGRKLFHLRLHVYQMLLWVSIGCYSTIVKVVEERETKKGESEGEEKGSPSMDVG